jgi:hypothetical protein
VSFDFFIGYNSSFKVNHSRKTLSQIGPENRGGQPLSRISQMTRRFEDLLGRFCYKNQCNTFIATGKTRVTRRVIPKASHCGSISTAA